MLTLSQLAINNEGFIFNPSTGDSYQVSQTGLTIITCLRDGNSEDETVHRLIELYEISADIARRDLTDFQASLKMLGLA